MSRRHALLVLVTIGVLTIGVKAWQTPPPGVLDVEKLKDNMYVLKGGGSNTTVLIRTDGVTIVDTKFPGWGKPILDEIKELTDKPVTMIINSHSHVDHVSGNPDFPATVEVVVQENTKPNMEKMTPPGPGPGLDIPWPNSIKEAGGRGKPTRTFKDRLSIGNGRDRIDLYYLGRGHTNGDAWTVFPAAGVLAAGDIVFGKTLPILDANNGGSGVAIVDTLAKALELKGVDTIVTGHSAQMTMNELREYAAFNKEFLAAVREAKNAGKSAEDFAKTWQVPAKYTGYNVTPVQMQRSAQAILDELK